jgi:hypothetical protein
MKTGDRGCALDSVDGVFRTWGSVSGPLAAGASVTIGTNGGPYTMPNGTHTITAHVDDINRLGVAPPLSLESMG